MIEGNKVILREITLDDTDDIIRWRNNPNVKKNFCIQSDFTIEGHTKWYNTMILTGKVKQFVIIDRQAGFSVGSVYLRDIDYTNKKAEYGIFIGEDSCRGKGLGSEAAKLIIEFGFNNLKLHKIFLRVFSNNVTAINSYKKAGFDIEGVFKDDICLGDGKFQDMTFMAIINNKFEGDDNE